MRLTEDLERDAVRYQGNWIPHKLRSATGDGVFFVGDSAGHCLPLTAEGIRTAFYFGIACGRELRRTVEGRSTPETALRRYARLLRAPRMAVQVDAAGAEAGPAGPAAAARPALRGMERGSFVDWSFGHYLRIADPSFAAGQRTIRNVPASSRATPTTRSSVIGGLLEPEHAEPVEHDRGGELARDRRRSDAAGADRAHGDQRREHVGGAEHAAEQVVPAARRGPRPGRPPDR